MDEADLTVPAADAPPAAPPVPDSIDAGAASASAGEGAPQAQSPLEVTKIALEPMDKARAPEADGETGSEAARAEPPLPPDAAEWKVAADEARAFNSYLAERGLGGEDLRLGVDLVTAIKSGDPVQALAMLTPLYEQLQTRAGQTLPPDLAEAVNNGWVTEEYARQLAERLASGQTAEERLAAERQQREQAALARHQLAMHSAAADWEKTLSSRDPEFKYRAELVRDAAFRQVYATPPATPDALVTLLDEADRRVRAQFPKPPRPPTPHSPAPGRMGLAAAGPNSPLEATRLALQQGV